MKWNEEVTCVMNSAFHDWDCSTIDNEDLMERIKSTGLVVDNQLRDILEHHRRTRNLPYAQFIKSLILAQESKFVAGIENNHPINSGRHMNTIIHKDLPVASSAKAPYGTDNNLFAGGGRATEPYIDASIMTVLSSGSSTPQKTYGPVQGARDVFKESTYINTHSEISHIPPHMRSSFDPLCDSVSDGEISASMASPAHSVTTSNLISWDQQSLPVTESIVSSSRRHFGDKSTFRISEWMTPIVSSAPTPVSTSVAPSSISIIAYDPEIPPSPYRPIAKSGSAKRPENCPFATDADDLDGMRRRILMNPLGKISAPEPIASHTVKSINP
jgi:hypothetical protein